MTANQTDEQISQEFFQKLGKRTQPDNSPTDSYIDALVEWQQQQNQETITLTNLKPHFFGGQQGFGMKALNQITAGDICVSVSLKQMITPFTCAEDLKSFTRRQKVIAATPDLILALHLLHEHNKDSDSIWAAYIRSLPRLHSFSTPFNLPSVECFESTLKGTTVYPRIISVMKTLLMQFQFVTGALRQTPIPPYLHADSFDFQQFIWASLIVMTRRNEITLKSGQKIVCLIPIWDLCNHCYYETNQEPNSSKDNTLINTYFDAETERLVSFAAQDLNKGDQYLINYGTRNVAEFFMFSGFVPAYQYPYECIKVSLQLNNAQVRSLGLLCKGLTPVGAGSPLIRADFELYPHDMVSNQMNRGVFLAVQIASSNYRADSELSVLNNLDGSSMWIDDAHKVSALKWLKVRLQVMLMTLNKYSINAKYIESEVDAVKTAVAYRMYESNLLQRCINLCSNQ